MKDQKTRKAVLIYPDQHKRLVGVASKIGLTLNKTVELAVILLEDRLREIKEDGKPLIIEDQESYIKNSVLDLRKGKSR
jgi:hypothetical protein